MFLDIWRRVSGLRRKPTPGLTTDRPDRCFWSDPDVSTCDGMSQNLGLGTVSQSVPRSVSSSVTASSPLSSAGPAASGSTNSIDSSRSALTSNGPVLDQTKPDQTRPGTTDTGQIKTKQLQLKVWIYKRFESNMKRNSSQLWQTDRQTDRQTYLTCPGYRCREKPETWCSSECDEGGASHCLHATHTHTHTHTHTAPEHLVSSLISSKQQSKLKLKNIIIVLIYLTLNGLR